MPKSEVVTKGEVVRELLQSICYALHKHEVQYWKDCPGTDEERCAKALKHARDALAVINGKIRPEDV